MNKPKVDPRRAPVCEFFLKGICSRPNCHFSHVSQSSRFAVCENFLLKKFCPKGANCPLRHIRNTSAKNVPMKKVRQKFSFNNSKNDRPSISKPSRAISSSNNSEKVSSAPARNESNDSETDKAENTTSHAFGDSFLFLDSSASTARLNSSGDDFLDSFFTSSQSILPSFLEQNTKNS